MVLQCSDDVALNICIDQLVWLPLFIRLPGKHHKSKFSSVQWKSPTEVVLFGCWITQRGTIVGEDRQLSINNCMRISVALCGTERYQSRSSSCARRASKQTRSSRNRTMQVFVCFRTTENPAGPPCRLDVERNQVLVRSCMHNKWNIQVDGRCRVALILSTKFAQTR